MVWIFSLGGDVYFHDGSRLTAQDVKFSLELIDYNSFIFTDKHYSFGLSYIALRMPLEGRVFSIDMSGLLF